MSSRRDPSDIKIYSQNGEYFRYMCWNDKKCDIRNCGFVHSSLLSGAQVKIADTCQHTYSNLCTEYDCRKSHRSPTGAIKEKRKRERSRDRELEDTRDTLKRVRAERDNLSILVDQLKDKMLNYAEEIDQLNYKNESLSKALLQILTNNKN